MRLLVLTPSVGNVSLGYRDTFALVALECERRRISFEVADAQAPGFIAHGRNVLLGYAYSWPRPPLKTTPEDFVLWWDSDVSFQAHALFNLLDSYPKDVSMVARAYPLRSRNLQSVVEYLADLRASNEKLSFAAIEANLITWGVQVHYVDGRPVWLASDHGGLVEITHCGFGWVLFRASALHDFCNVALGDLDGEPPEYDWARRRIIRGFDLGRNPDGTTEGEDVSFCRRWRAAGGRIWCAPDAHVSNGGLHGRFADYIKAHNLGP